MKNKDNKSDPWVPEELEILRQRLQQWEKEFSAVQQEKDLLHQELLAEQNRSRSEIQKLNLLWKQKEEQFQREKADLTAAVSRERETWTNTIQTLKAQLAEKEQEKKSLTETLSSEKAKSDEQSLQKTERLQQRLTEQTEFWEKTVDYKEQELKSLKQQIADERLQWKLKQVEMERQFEKQSAAQIQNTVSLNRSFQEERNSYQNLINGLKEKIAALTSVLTSKEEEYKSLTAEKQKSLAENQALFNQRLQELRARFEREKQDLLQSYQAKDEQNRLLRTQDERAKQDLQTQVSQLKERLKSMEEQTRTQLEQLREGFRKERTGWEDALARSREQNQHMKEEYDFKIQQLESDYEVRQKNSEQLINQLREEIQNLQARSQQERVSWVKVLKTREQENRNLREEMSRRLSRAVGLHRRYQQDLTAAGGRFKEGAQGLIKGLTEQRRSWQDALTSTHQQNINLKENFSQLRARMKEELAKKDQNFQQLQKQNIERLNQLKQTAERERLSLLRALQAKLK